MRRGYDGKAGCSFVPRSFVAVFLGTLLVACAAPARPIEGEKAATAPTEKQEQPQYGGVFYMALSEGAATLDPYFSPGGAAANSLFRLIFESLLEYKQDSPFDDYREYVPVPWLAERWEQPDPVTYIFYLRRGVKWHDGQEFTAADVVFSYGRLMDPASKFPNRSLLAGVTEVRAIDPYTVKITRDTPAAEFLQALASNPEVALMPKHLGDRGEDFKKVAVGTGPFRLESYDRTKGSGLVRNDAYWQSGKPYLKGIQLFYGLDKSALLAAVATEQNDFYLVTDKKQFDALYASKRDLQYKSHVTEYNWAIRFNLNRKPFDDIRVRKAMNLSVDRKAMLDTLTFGLGGYDQPGAAAVSKAWAIPEEELLRTPGWRIPKEVDLAEARRLLAEAGLPEGFKTSLLYYTTHSKAPEIVEMVATHAKQVGIQVTLVGKDEATARTMHANGDYDLSIVLGGIRARPDSDLNVHLQSKGSQNKAGVNDPVLDDLIERQAKEMNRAERNKILLQINRHLIEKVYLMPMVGMGYFSVWQPYVKNLYLSYAGQPWLRRPEQIWLDLNRLPSDRPR